MCIRDRSSVEAVNGYCNLFVNREKYVEMILNTLEKDNLGVEKVGLDKTCLLYTSCRKSMPDTAERGNYIMAIFHFTVKIVGRSKGKSVISASAYLNGDVMKNEETGRISYYTCLLYTSRCV